MQVGPRSAAPSLHLLDLPTELLLEVLRDAPRAARTTCRTFRSLLDGEQKALSLRPRPPRSARRLQHLTALLHRLPSLTSLHVGSFEFRTLSFLPACPALESLTLTDAPLLSDPALAALVACQRLRSLDVSGCTQLRSLQALPSLTALRSLDLRSCGELLFLAPLVRCPHITSLMLGRLVADLGPLTALTSLASLVCDGGSVTELVGLVPCAASLTLLHVTGSAVEDLAPLSGHSRLTSLVLDPCYRLPTLAPLALFGGALTHLHLQDCDLDGIAPLSACSALTSLHLEEFDNIGDISPLASCTALATLLLRKCLEEMPLGPLSSLGRSLTHLDLHGSNVEDVSPLAPCTALRHLDLRDTGVEIVLLLAECTQLRTLSLVDSCVQRVQGEWLQQQIPHLQVTFGPSAP